MASIVEGLVDKYSEALAYADERSQDWFLLNRNPFPVWIITALYLITVWLGPKYMKSRTAFQLTNFMLVYNLGLAALSLYMFTEISLSTYDAGYSLGCTPYNEQTKKNPKELRVAKVFWWYFFSKAIELIDTVLMVLRKKNSQITFLHVYHHVSMLNIWWWVVMFIPGGLSWFGAWMNCLVHVFMYSYYGLSVIPSMREKLWWKRYLTQFQLIQFFFAITHTFCSVSLDCDFPQWGQHLLAWLMISYILLFANFYRQTYLRNSRHKQQDKKRDTLINRTTPSVHHSNGSAGRSEQSNGVISDGFSGSENGLCDNHNIPNGKTKLN